MRFLIRVIILFSFGCISLLWFLWRRTPLIQDNLSMKEERANSALTFDTFLHVQQLRKKTLRSFCNKHGKTSQLPDTQQNASQTLSSIMVNNKLNFLYCKIPGTGVEDWEALLEMLVEREGVTLHMPVPYQQQFGTSTMLSDYNVTSMEAMMKSYTKVIFIREPFQRLIYAYMHGLAEGLTFQEFIQYILEGGSRNASIEWTPLVSLCHPCNIQYDYIVIFGLLGSEVRYLMFRAGLPESIHVPEFIDSKIQWTYSWLEDQMFKELSLVQKKQLCRFFRFDFAAFRFPHSLLWDLICISERSGLRRRFGPLCGQNRIPASTMTNNGSFNVPTPCITSLPPVQPLFDRTIRTQNAQIFLGGTGHIYWCRTAQRSNRKKNMLVEQVESSSVKCPHLSDAKNDCK